MKKPVILLAVLVLSLAAPSGARAQGEVTLIAPGGAKAAIEQLIPGYETKSGNKVKASYGSGLGTKKQVASGEIFDVSVLQPPYPQVLGSGNVIADSATPLASVAVGVAVKSGLPKPDISTAAAVKKMLLEAKSISYPDATGGAAAGVSFDETLKQLSIYEQMQPKIKRARGGAGAMQMTAKGEVEIGLTFLSEMNEPGIDVVGPLPEDISSPTVLVGLISSHAKNPAGAKSLLKYLSSPEAQAAYRGQGMKPEN